MPKVYLKVKIKSLAAEARIIRLEEGRITKRDNPIRMSLAAHRRNEVRSEARAAQLAYGFIRGRSYASMEAKCWDEPLWSRVRTLASRYGEATVTPRELDEWAKGLLPAAKAA